MSSLRLAWCSPLIWRGVSAEAATVRKAKSRWGTLKKDVEQKTEKKRRQRLKWCDYACTGVVYMFTRELCP